MFGKKENIILTHLKRCLTDLYFYQDLTHKPLSTMLFAGVDENQPYELTPYQHRQVIKLLCVATKAYEKFSGDFEYPVNIMENMNPQYVFSMFRGQQFNKFSKYGAAVHDYLTWVYKFVHSLEFVTSEGSDMLEVDNIVYLTNRYDLHGDFSVCTAKFTTPDRVARVLLTDKEMEKLEEISDRFVED